MSGMTAEMWDRAEGLSLDALVGMAMRIIESPRPAPPPWMVAPNFRTREMILPPEAPAARSAACSRPYQSIREVPRLS
jgi:hypothetical protein